MPLITRASKGSPLSFVEMDGNLTYLEGLGFPFTGNAEIEGNLSVNFSEDLKFESSDNFSSPFGKQYLGGLLNWVDFTISGNASVMGLSHSSGLWYNGFIYGSTIIEAIGATLPAFHSGDLATFSYLGASASFLNGVSYFDARGLGDDETFRNHMIYVQTGASGETDSFTFGQGTYGGQTGEGELIMRKTNDAGEDIDLALDTYQTGFILSNDLSDNTASVLRIEDNNGDAILEFFNDYLVSETIPALDYADDAGASAAGVPIGGIYHSSGTIKIRLA